MIVVSLVIQCCIEMTSVLWLQCVMAIYTVYTILMGLMAITLSILNGFSKFFYCWKAKWIFNKINVTLPTIPSVCCCTTLQMLGVWNCGNFQKKNNLKIVSHLTKTETSHHMAARIHAQRRPRHSSIAFSMMVWSVPCQTCRKRCFSSQHFTAFSSRYAKTGTSVCCSERIGKVIAMSLVYYCLSDTVYIDG